MKKLRQILAASCFALIGAATVLLPAPVSNAAEPWVCTEYPDGNIYCASEEGWCWLLDDGTSVCGDWV